MNKTLLTLSAVGAAALLTACGGGGGNPPAAAQTASSKVSGIAVDDLILNGVVEAKNAKGDILATGRTSTIDGSYTLNVKYNGIVLLDVKCDNGSTMLNPETNSTSVCPADMSLRSIADVKEGVAQEVNISPLTDVVVARAKALAGENGVISTTAMETARSQIGIMFSVDPLADKPTEGTYSNIIDAIHKVADKDATKSVMDVTNDLADALDDGVAEGENVVKDLVEAMAAEHITNQLTNTNGIYTPPENPVALSDIKVAKTFIAEVRTQTSEADQFISTEEKSINEALDNTVLDIEYMGNAFDLLADKIGYMSENNRTEAKQMIGNREYVVRGDNGSYTYEITEDGKTWNGSIKFPAVLLGDEAEAEIYKAQKLTADIKGTLPLEESAVTKEGVEDSQSFDGQIVTDRAGEQTKISIKGKLASNGTSLEVKSLDAVVDYVKGKEDENGETEPDFKYLKLNNLVLQGKVGTYTIDGSLKVNGYTQNTSLAKYGAFIEMTGFYAEVSCDHSKVTDASMTFTYDGVTYDPNNVHPYYSYGFDFQDIEADLEYDDVVDNIAFTGTCEDSTDQVSLHVYHVWGDEEIANNGMLPSEITFEGTVSRANALLNGILNAKWLNAKSMDLKNGDSNDTALVDVSFNGKLQMPQRPEMLTTLTFKNELKNNKVQNNITASYTYDSTVINVKAAMDENLENGKIAITAPAGMKADITLKDEKITAGSTLTKDGKKLGSFEYRNDAPVIKYIDGSFEALF